MYAERCCLAQQMPKYQGSFLSVRKLNVRLQRVSLFENKRFHQLHSFQVFSHKVTPHSHHLTRYVNQVEVGLRRYTEDKSKRKETFLQDHPSHLKG